MKYNCFFVIMVFFMSVFIGVYAGEFDSARVKTGTVIKCSPEGDKDESVKPGEAVRALKKNCVLHLMPGDYNSAIEINVDNVIIEGEPGKYCEVDLKITGKNCIIRNLWFGILKVNEDIIVIDSVFSGMGYEYTNQKMTQKFYNCCFNYLSIVNSRNSNVSFERCTLANNSNRGIYVSYGEGGLDFSNCVLYSQNKVFFICEKNNRLSISNSVIYGETGIAEGNAGAGVKEKRETVLDLKGLKKICKLSCKGEIIDKKPIFKKEFKGCRQVDLENFILDDASPGKDKKMGANLDETGFPVPEADKKLPAETTVPSKTEKQ